MVPVSPFRLVHERDDIRCDPWRVLVAGFVCYRAADDAEALRVLGRVLDRWPTAMRMAGADERAVAAEVRSLGMQRARAGRLIRMSLGFVNNVHERPGNTVADLEGVGRYGSDAWALFVEGRTTDVHPIDRDLRRWLDWRITCAVAG